MIGNDVTIYQNVTLGGTNPTNGIGGKRHPTIMDNVIIGSGAQVIGPIVVGERARIGANAVVTDDVPEGATMIGFKARSTLVPVETFMREFMPYGTPCEELSEPDLRRFEALEQQLTEMRAELESLRRAAMPDAADIADAKRSGSTSDEPNGGSGGAVLPFPGARPTGRLHARGANAHPRPLRSHGRGGRMARLCDGFHPRFRQFRRLPPCCRTARRRGSRNAPRCASAGGCGRCSANTARCSEARTRTGRRTGADGAASGEGGRL